MVASMSRKVCAQALPPMKCECVVMTWKRKLNCEACIFQRKTTKVFDSPFCDDMRLFFKEMGTATETEAIAPGVILLG